MTKQFKNYDKELQQIVRLTPGGWRHDNCDSVFCNDARKRVFWHEEKTEDYEYTRTEYEKCRAAWLHETAGDVKASEVDWRAHCMKMVDAIENGTLGQVDDAVRAAKAALNA